MQPENISSGNNQLNPQTPNTPHLRVPSRQTGQQQTAVANLARQELDNIYHSDPNHNMPVYNIPAESASVAPTAPQAEATSDSGRSDYPSITHSFTIDPAYDRSLDDKNINTTKEAWQKYHSAWQSYYQEYYHRYYASYISMANAQISQANAKAQALESNPRQLSSQEAVNELRSDIRSRIANSARVVRRSKHFVPIASAAAVMLLFLFLQYNTVLTGYAAAYISPGTTSPSDIIVDPNSSDVVSDEPRLIIPKIAVDVPSVYTDTMGSTSAETAAKQDLALQKGVAWFGIPGADSHPGQLGNTVLSGHSSNDWLAPGDYKFVFARLDQLAKGDVIYLNYQGTRYTYTVTAKKVINPNDISALYRGDDKPILTLLTCTPVGTALNRLLVFAEQIKPAPNEAQAAPNDKVTGSTTVIPGNSPSSLQRLFGAK